MVEAPLREVLNLVAFAAAPRAMVVRDRMQSFRCAASAGAFHPIDIVLIRSHPRPRAMLVRAGDATLDLLRVENPHALAAALGEVAAILTEAAGDLLLLVADPRKTGSRYRNADALLWRDAGALMQTIHLCATAFRLEFCSLGLNGSSLTTSILGSDDRRVGVGLAMIGRPRGAA